MVHVRLLDGGRGGRVRVATGSPVRRARRVGRRTPHDAHRDHRAADTTGRVRVHVRRVCPRAQGQSSWWGAWNFIRRRISLIRRRINLIVGRMNLIVGHMNFIVGRINFIVRRVPEAPLRVPEAMRTMKIVAGGTRSGVPSTTESLPGLGCRGVASVRASSAFASASMGVADAWRRPRGRGRRLAMCGDGVRDPFDASRHATPRCVRGADARPGSSDASAASSLDAQRRGPRGVPARREPRHPRARRRPRSSRTGGRPRTSGSQSTARVIESAPFPTRRSAPAGRRAGRATRCADGATRPWTSPTGC